MSEPTKVTISRQAFEVLSSQPRGADHWWVTIEAAERWITAMGGRGARATATLQFPDRARAGTAVIEGFDPVKQPFGSVRANLRITLDQA